MCVVFDDAYLGWNQQVAAGVARPLYFTDSVVRLRHARAMAAVGSDQARLEELRALTMEALLAEIRSEISISMESAPERLAIQSSTDDDEALSH